MGKVYTIGEMLIDFTPNGKEEYKRNAGGAPANVGVCVAKLGGESAVITKLGEDIFGDYLYETLKKEGVDTGYVYRTKKANTALAFVSLDEKGERTFTFYRNPSADLFLSENNVEKINFKSGDILHFCSVDLVDYPVKKAHKRAIEKAKKAGAIISFDPNLRYNLWESADKLIETVKEFLPYADVVKMSEDELWDIVRLREEEAVAKLFELGAKVIFITRGNKGASVYTSNGYVKSLESEKANCVDSTGAGDTFIGTVLYLISKRVNNSSELGDLENDLENWMKYANKAAWYVVQKKGAITAMPSADEVFCDK